MPIKTIAVIGAGTMGHGIAKICAAAGLNVKMYSRNPETLKKGYVDILNLLREDVKNGVLSDKNVEVTYGKIHPTSDLKEAVAGVDMVIEAVVENLEIKQKLFKELDEICDLNVILATNTSGLSPTAIAEKSVNKDRLIATHFWCPPDLIPLVEVIPNDFTKSEVIDATVEWVKQIGKEPVRMKKECLGFIGNRMQYALLREALHIYEEGWADFEEIDKAVEYSFGRRYPVTGPFRSADLGGADIFYRTSSYLFANLSKADFPQDTFTKIFEDGKFGIKSGEGFYKWDSKSSDQITNKRKEVLNYFLKMDKEESK